MERAEALKLIRALADSVTSMNGFHITGHRDRSLGYTMDGIAGTQPILGGVATNRIMSTTQNATRKSAAPRRGSARREHALHHGWCTLVAWIGILKLRFSTPCFVSGSCSINRSQEIVDGMMRSKAQQQSAPAENAGKQSARRPISPAAKKRMAEATRKRWEEYRQAKAAQKNAPKKSTAAAKSA